MFEIKHKNKMRSHGNNNIFTRLRLLSLEVQFEGVIIYDNPRQIRVAWSWNMIAHLLRIPLQVRRENEWLISFWRVYLYNWNNDSNLRNRQMGNERRDLADLWFWLIVSFINADHSNHFHEIYLNHRDSSGVYILIQLNENRLNLQFTPQWEVWNDQFDLNDC